MIQNHHTYYNKSEMFDYRYDDSIFYIIISILDFIFTVELDIACVQSNSL